MPFKLILKGKNKKKLSHIQLLQRIRYDPLTGIFYWIDSKNYSIKNGSKAGSLAKFETGTYLSIYINGKNYLAHRLAWFYMTKSWPINQIDHKNLNTLDNKWKNLRQATNAQNNQNKPKRKDNTSGYKGVWYRKDRNRFVAEIQVNNRTIYLGMYKTAKEAHLAYCKGCEKYHKEYGRVC